MKKYAIVKHVPNEKCMMYQTKTGKWKIFPKADEVETYKDYKKAVKLCDPDHYVILMP